jgi:hypothetical protein
VRAAVSLELTAAIALDDDDAAIGNVGNIALTRIDHVRGR